MAPRAKKSSSEPEPEIQPQLYPCVPVRFLWLPKWARYVLGWISITAFTATFLFPVYLPFLALPIMWSTQWLCYMHYATLMLAVISLLLPMREWKAWRCVGQLWFEIFDFSTNFSPSDCKRAVTDAQKKQLILAMHPHGIVPFHAMLWCAFCEEYFTNWDTAEQEHLFGFGAAADIVCYLPFLRQWMGWVSAGSAAYKVLKNGLMHGKHDIVNSSGRIPRHLFVMPGGVAEIFVSTPGKHTIIFRGRKGLTRLSVETGAELIPVYVFGGTDFFHNLATNDSWLSTLSRKLQIGMTVFWGRLYSPLLPYTPKVSMVMGSPIPVPRGYSGTGPVPDALVEALHATYLEQMQTLFDAHKAAAGYADAVLEIR